MSIKELAARLGQSASLRTAEGLAVQVRVLDAKAAYGSDRYQVQPVAGSGQVWVDSSRLTFNPNQGASEKC